LRKKPNVKAKLELITTNETVAWSKFGMSGYADKYNVQGKCMARSSSCAPRVQL